MLKSYPYQKNIINRSMNTRDNVLVMLPTGGGKTHIASVIAEKSKKVLFIAPKINLLQQTVDSFSYLDPQTIHGQTKFDENKKVFVSTIQTISRRPDLLTKMNFETIIIDEVHFGNSGKMQEVIKSNHSGRFIGLSATPYDMEGKLLDGYETIIDDYDMKYLIENKFLTVVEAVCPFNVDLKGVKITAGDYNMKELDYRMSSPEMIATTVNATVDILKDKKKTIIFCVSIEHAEKISKAYKKVFKAAKIKKRIKTLHSKIPKDERDALLNEFIDDKGSIDILISVDMITTGFNAPPTDCMVIARPTKSQNLYKQMVGRGTRNFPGKKYCLMVDCGNVVANLGMPLDPIRIVEKKRTVETKGPTPCPSCGNKKPKKIIEDGKGGLLKVCSLCGGNEEEYVGDYIDTCGHCNFMHTYTSHEKNYIINEFGIALKCKGCKTINPLSYFNHSLTSAVPFEEYGAKEVIEEHIVGKRAIFFKQLFLDQVSRLLTKKSKAYKNALFMNKKDLPAEIYKKIVKELDSSAYIKSINELSRNSLRELFVDFCYEHTDNSKEELSIRIIKTEELYFKKYNKPMKAKMYRKSAVHYVKFLNRKKEEAALPTKPKIKKKGIQQKFDFGS